MCAAAVHGDVGEGGAVGLDYVDGLEADGVEDEDVPGCWGQVWGVGWDVGGRFEG